MKIVVFGATGFIGNNFVGRVSFPEDAQMKIVIRPNSLRRNMFQEKISENLDIIWRDPLDRDAILDVIMWADVVVWAIGYVGMDKRNLWQVNVEATDMISDVCLQEKKKLVYLSSIAVLSGNREIPLREDMPLCSSMLYGQSKLEAEQIIWQKIQEGLEAVILRPAMVYGENEPHLLPKIISYFKRFPFIFDGLNNKWHLCGIDGLVWVMKQAVLRDDMIGRSFIVADEQILTASQILETIAKGVGVKKLVVLNKNITSFLCLFPKIKKIYSFLRKERMYDILSIRSIGFRQKVSTEDGLKRAVLSILKTS